MTIYKKNTVFLLALFFTIITCLYNSKTICMENNQRFRPKSRKNRHNNNRVRLKVRGYNPNSPKRIEKTTTVTTSFTISKEPQEESPIFERAKTVTTSFAIQKEPEKDSPVNEALEVNRKNFPILFGFYFSAIGSELNNTQKHTQSCESPVDLNELKELLTKMLKTESAELLDIDSTLIKKIIDNENSSCAQLLEAAIIRFGLINKTTECAPEESDYSAKKSLNDQYNTNFQDIPQAPKIELTEENLQEAELLADLEKILEEDIFYEEQENISCNNKIKPSDQKSANQINPILLEPFYGQNTKNSFPQTFKEVLEDYTF